MDSESPSPVPILTMGVFYAGLGVGGALWMRGGGYRPWPADGLSAGPLALAVALGAGCGVLLQAAFWPFERLAGIKRLERAILEVTALVGWGNLFAVLPGVVLAEEVLFRGAMQPAWGIVAASVLFGLLHWVPPSREAWLYPVFTGVAGFAFGGLYWYTGGHLIAPYVAHLVFNAITVWGLRKKLGTITPLETPGRPDPER